MHVSGQRPEVGLIFHQLGTKAALEDMPGKKRWRRDQIIGVAGEKRLHTAGEVGLGRLEDDMQVVGYDGESVHAPGAAKRGTTEVFLKPIAVLVISYDILTPVAPGHEVVDRAMDTGGVSVVAYPR